jgi:hypothetical protein
MATGQLRSFFTEVRRLEKILDATDDFESIRYQIQKLTSFAEYAINKKGGCQTRKGEGLRIDIEGYNVPHLFKQFIEKNVFLAQKGREEFKAGFVNHFECLVGYYPE